MKLAQFAIATILLLSTSLAVRAESPTEAVKTTTEHVLGILNNPSTQGDAKKAERRRLIRKEIDARFDWEESARGCLGHNWSKRTPAEQKEFVKLFSQYLMNSYLDKYDMYYNNVESIAYKSEKIIDGYASVKTVLSTKAKLDHPIEYRLDNTNGTWRVYDSVIEGVSMVKNYRDQFDAIIQKSSYEALLKELRSKADEP